MDPNLSEIDLSILKKLSNPSVFSDELISYYLYTVGCKVTDPSVLRLVGQVAHLGVHKLLVEAKSIAASSKAESSDLSPNNGSNEDFQTKFVTDLDYQHLAEAFQNLDNTFRNFNLFLEPSLNN